MSEQQSLKDKTIKGTMWSAADAFLGQGVTFLVGIVLARLLSPDEYGLIGICLIFTTVLNSIVDNGINNALIRKKNICKDDYNTMFFTNIFISIALYLILFISAPTISVFFHRDELTLMVYALGTIIIINALSITQVTILTKTLDFKTKTKASLISSSISGVIGLSLAFGGFGVWSLVSQQIFRQLIYTLCLWLYVSWRPYWGFSMSSFSYMWGFGWKLILSGLLSSIWNQLYQVVVGKYYSPATLGQYTRSNEYASIFSSNLTSIIQRVSYPVLSEIQDDKQRMVEGYRRVIKMTMFITAICMISLGAVAEPLIYCLIGPQWHEAATYLPLICISMAFYPLHAINLNMLQVLGRSDIFLYLEIIKKVIGLVPICIGIFVDIYWMLVASILIGFVSLYLNSWYTGKALGYTFWKQLRDIAPSFGIAFTIAISVHFFKYLPISNWFILPIQIAVGAVVCIIACRKSQLEEYKEVMNIINPILNKIKK